MEPIVQVGGSSGHWTAWVAWDVGMQVAAETPATAVEMLWTLYGTEIEQGPRMMQSGDQSDKQANKIMQSAYGRRGQFCKHGQYRSLCPECSDLA